jgi:hypothetical protein
LIAGCHRVIQKDLKEKIVGTWDEARGTNEILEFHDDGTVLMQTGNTDQTCSYDFADAHHLRLNCAPPGSPPMPQIWKVEYKDDLLHIRDNAETGTYKRR